MVYVIEYLAQALKNSRQSKKLSQRALSQKVKVPQAQISKIENAAVDLKVSTLIQLARALDLEVMLVPRRHMTAVSGLIGAAKAREEKVQLQKPAYTLDDEDDNG